MLGPSKFISLDLFELSTFNDFNDMSSSKCLLFYDFSYDLKSFDFDNFFYRNTLDDFSLETSTIRYLDFHEIHGPRLYCLLRLFAPSLWAGVEISYSHLQRIQILFSMTMSSMVWVSSNSSAVCKAGLPSPKWNVNCHSKFCFVSTAHPSNTLEGTLTGRYQALMFHRKTTTSYQTASDFLLLSFPQF